MAVIDVLNKCTECGACVAECLFLTNLGMTPKKMAEDLMGEIDVTKTYPYSCFLCGLCKSLCPNDVDVADMILEARKAIASSYGPLNACYKLFLADEQNFIMDAYKRRRGISYEAYTPKEFQYAFLPGCAMACFSPKATVKVYELLKDELQSVGIIDMCCGKPMYDIGLADRASNWLDRISSELKGRGSTTLVTACPNCYYYLKAKLKGKFEVATIYDFIGNKLKDKIKGLTVTIHDSCPDRHEGIFAKWVRDLLSKCEIVEMKHSRERTLCCGAGGLVSCIDPSLPSNLMSKRLEEILETGAQIVVVYCYSCANMYWSLQPALDVKHVLNLALQVEDESEVLKQGELAKLASELISAMQ